jgi:hypothetical protein
MRPLTTHLLKAAGIVWLLACTTVLWFAVQTWEPGPNSDAGIVFAWSMLALTFPAGILVPIAIAALASTGALDALPPMLCFVITWFAFLLVGYVQWFKVAPTVWRRVSRVQSGSAL